MKVIEGERLPIKVWSEDIDLADSVFIQARNLANHPIAVKHVCLMPDYHHGYGMPIGGVLATQGGVVPYAVGVDIGCGMIAVRTEIEAESLDRDTLQALRIAVPQRVPVGQSHHKTQAPVEAMPDPASAPPVVRAGFERARFQLGSLGGGNHFIEIQRDAEDGAVWIMLHSGSRNLGKTTCDHFHKTARAYMERFHSAVPDMELAFLPAEVPEYDEYLASMRWCMDFAERNREAMLQAVYAAFAEVCGSEPAVTLKVDTHHNFAATERHFGQNVLVHRKGAVKAEGLVTIPGSMGTASYIGRGLEPRESFNTCSHGAGRLMGRKIANKTITAERARESMSHVVFGIRDGDFDEMPDCYKDIDSVMRAQSDLVEPLHRLLPLAVVKG